MQQDILEEYPKAKIKVYAVWTKRRFTDERSRVPEGLFKDARVAEFWDAEQLVGAFLGEHLLHKIDWLMGDTYALYGPESRWDNEPTHLISWYRTILAGFDRLKSDVEGLLKPR